MKSDTEEIVSIYIYYQMKFMVNSTTQLILSSICLGICLKTFALEVSVGFFLKNFRYSIIDQEHKPSCH